MNFNELINRENPPVPWQDGEKIPWNDPEFSQRMLQNHLSQDHDWASRRQNIIDSHIEWISGHLEPGSRILDLACGPGLYTQRLAERGYYCRGVDFSPASISYARNQSGLSPAETSNRRTDKGGMEYVLEDIREYLVQDRFDCVMLVFGEFNVFTEADARTILSNVSQMLRSGGLFVLEGHTFEAVRESGLSPSSWWTCHENEGILSARPHLCLQENYWDETTNTATTRYFTVDEDTAEINSFCSSMTGYTMSYYEKMLIDAGFHTTRVLSSEQWPTGGPFEGQMMTLTCLRN